MTRLYSVPARPCGTQRPFYVPAGTLRVHLAGGTWPKRPRLSVRPAVTLDGVFYIEFPLIVTSSSGTANNYNYFFFVIVYFLFVSY